MSAAATEAGPPQRRPATPLNVLGLRQFLLATLVAGIWISYWGLAPQLTQLRQSVLAMRAEAGKLVIEDPNRIHVLQLSTLRDRHFPFRIYLPTSRRYNLHFQAHDIAPSGFGGSRVHSFTLPPGEHLLELAAIRLSDLSNRVEFSLDGQKMKTIARPDEWDSASASWTSAGGNDGTAFDPAEEYELLRLRFSEVQPDGTYKTPDNAANGLLMWLTEQ